MSTILTLQPGTRIGHYEIVAAIGSGGMGEVWKARDTRLRRDVAIKALPAAVAHEPARLARLEREAELLATLNHPHIATIHGIDEQGGTRFLVLELVEGVTLDALLRRGKIPVQEALTLALQLAQALEAAHDKGIIHRDLKPANIKITPDKRVKVLDFGIAKALAAASDEDETQAVDPTRTGAVIGTPAYMSPEQARGETVGVQTDIWAFGAVLFEMLTGTSPFRRRTTAETLASVLQSQPDYQALPTEASTLVRRLIQRSVEKDRSRRLQHMGDVRILLEEEVASLGSDTSIPPLMPARRRGAWTVAAILAAAFAGVGLWYAGTRSTGEGLPAPLHLSIPFLGRPAALPYGQRHLAISSDGSTVAVATGNRLWIRRIDQKDAISVATGPASNPFFSPDGDWVGLFLETALVKVPMRGGTPVTITPVTDRPAGATWGTDGTIVFATSEALYEVSANGGERKVIAQPDRGHKEILYAWPFILPRRQALLFTVVSADTSQGPQTVLLDLKTLERKSILQGSSAVYLLGGQLLYVADSMLHAVPFDAAAATVAGKAQLLPGVELGVSLENGAANFAVSDNGTLVFTPPMSPSLRTLDWIDRQGNREALAVEPQTYGYAMVSPDGTRVAVERTTRGNRDIWILDLKRLTQTQLTDGPTEDMLPVWSPDSTRVFFASRRTGNFDVYSQAADGASPAKLEYAGPEIQVPNSLTPDGNQLVIYERFQDLSLLDLSNPGRLEPLLHTTFDERLAQLSPDGRWVAYESDESGNQFEIIVRSFPEVNERRETISVGGGRYPRWGPIGSNELYYVSPAGAMMAASITLSPTLVLGPSKKLFDWQKPTEGRSGRWYDVGPDGRFLVAKPVAPDPDGPTTVQVVLNWLAGIQKHPR